MEILFVWIIIFLAVFAVFFSWSRRLKRREAAFIEKVRSDYGNKSSNDFSYAYMQSLKDYMNESGLATPSIDDCTWNDLEMDKVYAALNYCHSNAGDYYLYKLLRQKGSIDEFTHFEDAVTAFAADAEKRSKYQLLFKKMGRNFDLHLLYSLNSLKDIRDNGRRDRDILNCSLVIFFALGFINPWLWLAAFVMLCTNVTHYFKNKARIANQLKSISYIVRFLEQSLDFIKYDLSPINSELEIFSKNKEFLRSIALPKAFVSGTSDSSNPIEMLMVYVKMITHIDIYAFYALAKKISAHTDEILSVFNALGFIETAISTACFRASLNEYCKPLFTQDCQVEFTDLYHPLIQDAVKNNIKTNANILITGSNATGKSTFLKSVALNLLLGQTIHTCMAKTAAFPRCHIMSAMKAQDDVTAQLSYYLAEITAIKRISDHISISDIPVMCFLDEVLKGTNTTERIAAGAEILRSFVKKHVLCFGATHDLELTRILEDVYDNYHFTEDFSNGEMLFTYKILQGRATGRNAIRLLEAMGFSKDIVQSAFDRAQSFDERGSWEI